MEVKTVEERKEAQLRDMLRAWYLFQNKWHVPSTFKSIEVLCVEGKPFRAVAPPGSNYTEGQIDVVLDRVAMLARFFYGTACSFFLHVRFDGVHTFVTDVTLAS